MTSGTGAVSLRRRTYDRVPSSLQQLARTVLQAWGWCTAPWRELPDFIVIGAQRSGTTTLYRLLSEHPNVRRPLAAKGIGYFDLNFHRGTRWYRAHFPVRRALLARSQHARPLVFESSGYYLFHPWAAERMAQTLPGIRVVVLVRNPVDRAHSAHRHELVRGFESEDFETAIGLEEGRLAGQAELLRDPRARSEEHRHHGYLARSRYAEQVARYHAALGTDRVYVMDADDFFRDPRAEFAALQRWLGLPHWDPPLVEQWNARPREDVDPELRRRLEDYFAEHDAALAALTGRVPSWRRSGDPQTRR